MIVQWFLDFWHTVFQGFLAGLGALLPTPPGFWSGATTAIDTLYGHVSAPVRYFVPIGPLLAAGLTLVALRVAMGVVVLARRALSLFTGGGGMA